MSGEEYIYGNDKIRKLVSQRDILNIQIEHEIKKEKAKYKFSWKRFLLMIAIVFGIPFSVYVNVKIFPNNSIFSWNHYIDTGFKH